MKKSNTSHGVDFDLNIEVVPVLSSLGGNAD